MRPYQGDLAAYGRGLCVTFGFFAWVLLLNKAIKFTEPTKVLQLRERPLEKIVRSCEIP